MPISIAMYKYILRSSSNRRQMSGIFDASARTRKPTKLQPQTIVHATQEPHKPYVIFSCCCHSHSVQFLLLLLLKARSYLCKSECTSFCERPNIYPSIISSEAWAKAPKPSLHSSIRPLKRRTRSLKSTIDSKRTLVH
jgi:hypothetical protein